MNFWMSKNSFYYKNQKNLVERIIYLFEASVLGNSDSVLLNRNYNVRNCKHKEAVVRIKKLRKKC